MRRGPGIGPLPKPHLPAHAGLERGEVSAGRRLLAQILDLFVEEQGLVLLALLLIGLRGHLIQLAHELLPLLDRQAGDRGRPLFLEHRRHLVIAQAVGDLAHGLDERIRLPLGLVFLRGLDRLLLGARDVDDVLLPVLGRDDGAVTLPLGARDNPLHPPGPNDVAGIGQRHVGADGRHPVLAQPGIRFLVAEELLCDLEPLFHEFVHGPAVAVEQLPGHLGLAAAGL